ncbi:hypothetical protein COT99_02750 [Candidatus Falkowbacteria bacterium CG10_big_fil_rev_8_21_14_0_10_43_10]|uniref:Adenylate kinase n=1 Tax=Candidatus Falkowbacteria bacterium CG10_big_fil_rev_8_21_14_0_10_43_10 TaxID=1974567 RepID=A0A2H0V1Y9_9BACT|nr:MAG: hypothetical protein COT99_02750 [Candidatus Falkowbacteria bacterium CG10_big_fil_rev_8_21_14_0_10_43_10]
MKEYKNEFPRVKTKIQGVDKKFNLSDPAERMAYFEAKAGDEIKRIKKFLKNNSFIAYWLGKKNSGKGTYSKMLIDIFGEDKIAHISVGDVVRNIHASVEDKNKMKELKEYLAKNYRGYISADEAIDRLLGRDTKSLLPTEFILTLVKKEIDKMKKKSIFIDGFPRDLDQVSYSLYFRDLINYRDDLDIFIAIDIPEAVIEERMKYRVVCPKCQTPRNIKLLATKKVIYNEPDKKFELVCDDPACGEAVMAGKEGDNAGMEEIRARLELDDKLIDKVFSLYGVPKALLRNSVPVKIADEYVDDYEITPEYYYELDKDKNVKVLEKPWTVKDDEGEEAYSLLAPPVVVQCIKQLAKILG